jgi:hypothetical protein
VALDLALLVALGLRPPVHFPSDYQKSLYNISSSAFLAGQGFYAILIQPRNKPLSVGSAAY